MVKGTAAVMTAAAPPRNDAELTGVVTEVVVESGADVAIDGNESELQLHETVKYVMMGAPRQEVQKAHRAREAMSRDAPRCPSQRMMICSSPRPRG